MKHLKALLILVLMFSLVQCSKNNNDSSVQNEEKRVQDSLNQLILKQNEETIKKITRIDSLI